MLTQAEVQAHLADAQNHTTTVRGAVRAEVRVGTARYESSWYLCRDPRTGEWTEKKGAL